MFAPLFNGIAPFPPTGPDGNNGGPPRIRDRPNVFADEPGVLPPVPGRTAPFPRPGAPNPPETVIQPPGAIVVRPRLAVPPAREPLEASTLEAEAEQLPITSTTPLMSVSGDAFAGNSPFLSPGVFIPNISVSPQSTVGAIMKPFGLLGYTILYDPALQRDFVGLAYLSAGSLGFIAATTNGATDSALIAFLSNNFASIGYTAFHLNGYIMQAYSAYVVGWRDYVGLTGQYVWLDQATGNIIIAGALYARTARRDVFDLGNYTGKSVKTLAAAHNIPAGTPVRRVEVRSRTGNILQLRGGGGTTMIAGMLRFDADSNRDVAYRTFMTQAQVRDLVFEGKGPRLFFKNKARALGWAKEPLPVPNHLVPENIPLGDEVQIVTSGTYIVGLMVGQLAGWATGQAWFRSDLEISIRRIAITTVEVTITPVKLRAASLYAFDPLGPHAASRGTKAMVTRQTLTFDLTEPEARKAYLKVIKGKVPQAVPKRHTLTRHPLTPEDIRKSVQQANLPRGVRRTFAHTLQGSLTDLGGGIKWLFVPTEILPRGMQLALTTHRQRAHETQTVTNGQIQHNAETYSHLAITERLNGGRKAVYTVAQQINHAENGGPNVFDALHLSSTYSDTRLRGNNFNRRLVGTLNQRFDAGLDNAEGKHVHEERQMQIARRLDATHLEALATWQQTVAPQAPMVASIRMARVARSTGVSYREISKFMKALAAESDPSARALVLQKFVQSHHIKGFAAVHHLLDNDASNINISTNSSAYDEPLAQTEALCLRYQAPITSTTSSKVIEQRYHDVEKVLRLVQKARAEVNDDSLMDIARNYYLMLLKTSEDRLYALLNLPTARIHRVQRRTRKHFIKRSWHGRVAMAVTSAQSLIEPVRALQRTWQDKPAPTDPKAFIARFRSLYLVTVNVQKHLDYLEKDGILVSPEKRLMDIAAMRQARATLAGDAPFPDGTFGGLLNVGALTPAQRTAMLKALPRHGRNPALKALRHQLSSDTMLLA